MHSGPGITKRIK